MEIVEKFRREVYLRLVFAIQDTWKTWKFIKQSGIGDTTLNLELPDEEFLRMEDEQIMEQILAHYGWDTFLKEVQYAHYIKDKDAFIQTHSPCDGPTKQCTFLCPKYPC